MVRIAVVTDIHYGHDGTKKKGLDAPDLVDRFVRVANKNNADCAIDLGDRKNKTSPAQDRENEQKLLSHFNALSMPFEGVDGNHDVGHLPRNPSYIRQIGDRTFIFWNPDMQRNPEGYRVTADDLAWLAPALSAAPRRVVLCSHIPLDNEERDDIRTSRRDKGSYRSFYQQGPEIRAMLKASGKVEACLSGHRHRNRVSILNGIPYFTFQSLVQLDKKSGHACGAFRLIDFKDDRIEVKSYGRRQKDIVIIKENEKVPARLNLP